MTLDEHDYASVVTHALAQHVLTDLRSAETGQVEFRENLVSLGRLCGEELVEERFGTETVTVETPLAEATGERVAGRDDVVIISVLRAAVPFVEGLMGAFPAARQGVVSASRNEDTGMASDGKFPVDVEYVKLPEIRPEDTVIVADPMLATGSTMNAVLDIVTREGDPQRLVALSVVSAPAGLGQVRSEFPDAELITVSIDDHLDDDGYIVPGLGDAGDRSFGT